MQIFKPILLIPFSNVTTKSSGVQLKAIGTATKSCSAHCFMSYTISLSVYGIPMFGAIIFYLLTSDIYHSLHTFPSKTWHTLCNP